MSCWYEKDGLKFSCKGCGDCCRGPGGYVWVKEAEIIALAEAVRMTVEAFGKRYLRRSGLRLALIDGPDGNCVFLENGRCKVYDSRPVQCRTFPWWPEYLKSAEEWEQLKDDCPGVGSGKVHSHDKIAKAIDQLRHR